MEKLCMIIVLLAALSSLTACNTVRGVGQDIQGVGEAVKDAAP